MCHKESACLPPEEDTLLIAPPRRSPRRWSDSEQRHGANAVPIPGVTYQLNTVLIGGGAKSLRPVNGKRFDVDSGRGRCYLTPPALTTPER
jgi:hypothetical protein